MIAGASAGVHRGRESPRRTDLFLNNSGCRPGWRDKFLRDAGEVDNQVDLTRTGSSLLKHASTSIERKTCSAFVTRDMDGFNPDVALEINVGGERFGRYLFVAKDIGDRLLFRRQVITRSDDADPGAHKTTFSAMTRRPENPFRAKRL